MARAKAGARESGARTAGNFVWEALQFERATRDRDHMARRRNQDAAARVPFILEPFPDVPMSQHGEQSHGLTTCRTDEIRKPPPGRG
jgi:hypothetical protein